MSQPGRAAARRLQDAWPDAQAYEEPAGRALPRAFAECAGIVCFLPIGVAVRLIAPLLCTRGVEPGVVCVDDRMRYAVTVLGAHSGRGDALAIRTAQALGAHAVITSAPRVPCVAGAGREVAALALLLGFGGMDPYLLGLRLAGRRVVVVGGGAVAARRMPGLLGAGADVTVISPSVTTSLEDLARAGRIAWEARAYRTGDCAGAWLVCACAGSSPVNAAVAAEAEERRIWCVRADDGRASAAVTPASGGAGPVRVGVLSGEPRRSAAIRDAIVRSGLLSSGLASGRGGSVAIVGGGPGDPGLITVRGRELLAAADVVVADRLAPRPLLGELPPDVELIDAAKIPYGRAMSQDEINGVLVSRARQGKFVVRLKGGDPFVFGRGAEEVLACARAGIPVTVVPGVTSAVAVPAAAGIPVTHRGISASLHVVSVHVAPDDERSTVDWDVLARSTGTLVLLMGLERIGTVADVLIGKGRNPATPVCVIADGTLPTQRTIVSTLEDVAGLVAEEGVRPPAIIVVGEVVRIATDIAAITELGRR